MGTLDRENRIYNWRSNGPGDLSIFGARPGSADPFAREIYRLAVLAEDQDEQIQNQARTIFERDRTVARQETTIKSLREQLLAANEKERTNWQVVPAGSLFLHSWATINDHDARLDTQAETLASQVSKTNSHGVRLSAHEARLDAMEEVFDKIKDIL